MNEADEQPFLELVSSFSNQKPAYDPLKTRMSSPVCLPEATRLLWLHFPTTMSHSDSHAVPLAGNETSYQEAAGLLEAACARQMSRRSPGHGSVSVDVSRQSHRLVWLALQLLSVPAKSQASDAAFAPPQQNQQPVQDCWLFLERACHH